MRNYLLVFVLISIAVTVMVSCEKSIPTPLPQWHIHVPHAKALPDGTTPDPNVIWRAVPNFLMDDVRVSQWTGLVYYEAIPVGSDRLVHYYQVLYQTWSSANREDVTSVRRAHMAEWLAFPILLTQSDSVPVAYRTSWQSVHDGFAGKGPQEDAIAELIRDLCSYWGVEVTP